MSALKTLQNFDLENAAIVLWTFKGPNGLSDKIPAYSGKWVDTSADVDATLKQAVSDERDRIEEELEYSLLAENHETSALTIKTAETHSELIIEKTNAGTPNHKVMDEKHLLNTTFYVIKLTANDETIYAVKKTDSSWSTKKRINAQTFFFSDLQLAIDDRPHFQISKKLIFS